MNKHHETERRETERRVVDALATRSADLPDATPDLHDVWRHLDRRRRRRRHRVATAGSLAVVGVGAIGLLSLRTDDPAPLAGGVGPAPDQQAAWRCTDQLEHFEQGSRAVFFATCEQVSIDGGAAVIDDYPDPTTPIDPATMMTTTTSIFVGAPGTAPVDEIRYTVREGDTVRSIAEEFHTTPGDIGRLNGWNDLNTVTLVPGDSILVQLVPTATTAWAGNDGPPVPTTEPRTPFEQEYLIRAGDSLGAIAERFDITLEQLVNYNEFPDGASHLILPGDVIRIPPDALLDTASLATTTTTTSSVP